MPESLPPGPSVPALVQNFGWAWRPLAYLRRCQREYGDLFTLRLEATGTWVFVADPALVKTVLTAGDDVSRAGEAAAFLTPIMGHHSLFTLDGAAHMRERRLLLPAFHGRRLAAVAGRIAARVEQATATWPVGRPFPLIDHFRPVALASMLENVLGITDPAVVRQFGEAAMGILDWACHPMRLTMGSMFGYERTARTLRFENVRAPLDRAVMRKIAARRRDPAIDERDDVLSMLMQSSYEDGRTMSDQELRDEAVTLLMAGYETTACTVAWAIERLVRSPVHLWRLQSELRAGADERCVDPVITETLRMRPVVPVVLRRLVAPMELGGYRLPAGTLVVPCAYLLHRRPDLYPEPDRFLPERWEGRRPDTYGWLPFGGGPRRCLGASFATMTARIAVATILRSLDLNPAENDPGEQPRRRANMFVPCEGARVVGTRVVATGVRRQPARKAEERVPIDV